MAAVDRELKNQSSQDIDFFEATVRYFDNSRDTTLQKLENFAKFVPRQTLAKFLVRYELFKKILEVNGSIVECGVLRGGGLLTFAKLSSIFEPVNHTRKIIGFDTFAGFPSVHEKDSRSTSSFLEEGGLGADSVSDLFEALALYDMNRAIQHISKVELVQGDIGETLPKYVEEHQHLVVSLLYLDVDLYEPTRVAIECLRDRMPKGSIVVFDELNTEMFQGETIAVQETLGLSNLRIQRFPFDSFVSYAVL